MSDHDVAAELAEKAGALLLALRRERGGSEGIGALGDLRSNRLLLDELARRHPGDAVLSEESADRPDRLEAARVWIIDPLDGTREFGEAGRDDWAVHVALWERGELSAGAVALPARRLVVSTRDAVPPSPRAADSALRILVSRTRPPQVATSVATALNAELVPMGSAGAKTAAVILGEADAYIHGGGQYEWDSAAPAAVAMKAGLHVSRLDGTPCRYNQPDPSMPDFLVCRRELAMRILELLAGS